MSTDAHDEAPAVSCTVSGRPAVATIRIDDGKANAMTLPMVEQTRDAVRRAGDEADAVVVLGRPGYLCAGLHRETATYDAARAIQLFESASRLALELFTLPKPVVIGCTGHALGGGAITLLCGDVRIGVRGAFAIGMIEVANSTVATPVGLVLARERLVRSELVNTTLCSRRYEPHEALAAGFLDELVDPDEVEARCQERAAALASLHGPSYAGTKRVLWAPAVEEAQAAVDAAVAQLTKS